MPVTDGEEEEGDGDCSSVENEDVFIGQTETGSDPNSSDSNNNSKIIYSVDQHKECESKGDNPYDEDRHRRSRSRERVFISHQRKYKKSLIEKYFQEDMGSDAVTNKQVDNHIPKDQPPPLQLRKWIESSAKFTPDKFNYTAWEMDKMAKVVSGGGEKAAVTEMHHHPTDTSNVLYHQFGELEAAEALARLACN